MKKLKSLYLLFFIPTCIWGQEVIIKGKLTTIELILDEKTSGVDQWLYWFCVDRGGSRLVDSCYIEKDQMVVYMEAYLEDEYYNYSTLFFSLKGPDAFKFYLLPGENAKYDFTTRKYENTPTTSDIYDQFMGQAETLWRCRALQAERDSITDPVLQKQLSDSIEHYEYLFQQGNFRNMFKNAKTPYSCRIALAMLEEFLSDEEMDEYVVAMKERFPNSKPIQLYPEQEIFPQRRTTEETRERSKQLNARKYDMPLVANMPEGEKEKIDIQLENIPTYKLGEVVDSLTEQGLDGIQISLDDINTPYVLIDFWASWCIPCLREFSNLQEALELYLDSLTIYAVSLDDKETDWIRIINSRKIEAFTHVRTGSSDALKGRTIMKRFGIEYIPANFLLDKDRKIIAINLKGKELKEKMKEVMK